MIGIERRIMLRIVWRIVMPGIDQRDELVITERSDAPDSA